MLRKLQAQHIHTIKRVNFDRFHDEQYRVRRDFDKIFRNSAATHEEINAMLEKYELYIEHNFEPYAAMHESRQHSNLWGKMVLWGDEALISDHVGFYSKNRLVNAEPTSAHFHEEYPHQVQAWMYDEHYMNTDFNYEDLEQQYIDKQDSTPTDPQSLKDQLDQKHM